MIVLDVGITGRTVKALIADPDDGGFRLEFTDGKILKIGAAAVGYENSHAYLVWDGKEIAP